MASAKKSKPTGVVALESIFVDGVLFEAGEQITGVDKQEVDKVVRMGRAAAGEPEADGEDA